MVAGEAVGYTGMNGINRPGTASFFPLKVSEDPLQLLSEITHRGNSAKTRGRRKNAREER